MSVESIRDSMSESDRAKFERGAECLKRLQEGRAFDDWVVIGEGLLAVRDTVMKVLRLKKPRGGYYNDAFGKICKQTAYADMPKDERSNLLYCMDNLATIEKMRADWTPSERANVCHPDSMRKRLRAFAGDPQASNKEPRKSAMATLKEEYVSATAKIARLQEIVNQGSTFSARDTYKDLAQYLADRILDSQLSRDKARKMLKRTAELLNAYWAKEDAEFERRKDARPEDSATAE
jgi:hypothetical protein